MANEIFGRTWEEIQHMQMRRSTGGTPVDTSREGDYGADPIGDGTFKMVPSGDIVSFEERNRRLAAR